MAQRRRVGAWLVLAGGVLCGVVGGCAAEGGASAPGAPARPMWARSASEDLRRPYNAEERAMFRDLWRRHLTDEP